MYTNKKNDINLNVIFAFYWVCMTKCPPGGALVTAERVAFHIRICSLNFILYGSHLKNEEKDTILSKENF